MYSVLADTEVQGSESVSEPVADLGTGEPLGRSAINHHIGDLAYWRPLQAPLLAIGGTKFQKCNPAFEPPLFGTYVRVHFCVYVYVLHCLAAGAVPSVRSTAVPSVRSTGGLQALQGPAT